MNDLQSVGKLTLALCKTVSRTFSVFPTFESFENALSLTFVLNFSFGEKNRVYGHIWYARSICIATRYVNLGFPPLTTVEFAPRKLGRFSHEVSNVRIKLIRPVRSFSNSRIRNSALARPSFAQELFSRNIHSMRWKRGRFLMTVFVIANRLFLLAVITYVYVMRVWMIFLMVRVMWVDFVSCFISFLLLFLDQFILNICCLSKWGKICSLKAMKCYLGYCEILQGQYRI